MAGGLALAAAGQAHAAPEEIEVYRNESNGAGRAGLEANLSYVFSGKNTLDYPGQQAPVGRYRLTPELTYGLTSSLEAGSLAVIIRDARGRTSLDGVKTRLRWLAAGGKSGLYWGTNLEAGWSAHRSDPNPWSAELRGIVGYEGQRLVWSVNPTLEWTLSGPDPEPAQLELQSKLGWRVKDGLILGLESYNSLGPLRHVSSPRQEEQITAGRGRRQ